MRTHLLLLLLLLAAVTWIGCGPKAADSADASPSKMGAENSSTAAKDAPAAEGPGPDVPRPGGGKKP